MGPQNKKYLTSPWKVSALAKKLCVEGGGGGGVYTLNPLPSVQAKGICRSSILLGGLSATVHPFMDYHSPSLITYKSFQVLNTRIFCCLEMFCGFGGSKITQSKSLQK